MSKEPIIVKNSDKAPIRTEDYRELSSPTQKHKLKRRHNLTIAICKILKFYGRAPINSYRHYHTIMISKA